MEYFTTGSTFGARAEYRIGGARTLLQTPDLSEEDKEECIQRLVGGLNLGMESMWWNAKHDHLQGLGLLKERHRKTVFVLTPFVNSELKDVHAFTALEIFPEYTFADIMADLQKYFHTDPKETYVLRVLQDPSVHTRTWYHWLQSWYQKGSPKRIENDDDVIWLRDAAHAGRVVLLLERQDPARVDPRQAHDAWLNQKTKDREHEAEVRRRLEAAEKEQERARYTKRATDREADLEAEREFWRQRGRKSPVAAPILPPVVPLSEWLKRASESVQLPEKDCPSRGKEPHPPKDRTDFKSQALLFHPDKNPACVDAAGSKFKKLYAFAHDS